MKNLRFLPLVLVFALSLVLSGCSGSKPGGISETLAGIYATEASLAQKQLTITVSYANENVSALGFSGATHKVFLNGTYIGKAVSKQPFGIPPVQSVTQQIVVPLENTSVVSDLLARGNTSTISYHLESHITQTIYEDDFSYDLSAQGSTELHASAPPAAK